MIRVSCSSFGWKVMLRVLHSVTFKNFNFSVVSDERKVKLNGDLGCSDTLKILGVFLDVLAGFIEILLSVFEERSFFIMFSGKLKKAEFVVEKFISLNESMHYI
jgi:hypothetical protein